MRRTQVLDVRNKHFLVGNAGGQPPPVTSLSRKASRRKWNKKGLLPIHCSAIQGRIDIIQALMDFDTHPRNKITEISDKRDTPSLLYLSVANNQLKCANWLISKAVTFKPGEQEELIFNILLDELKVEDQVQGLNFLLRSGVNINALNEKGKRYTFWNKD
ncbi:hypothetical protein NDU88_004730 [Pleurodeles waltl]|uniref:Uncharacterized protein n=1 Tax=Pleurodeles waltl TaxID=8319 RepID=A0AAV7SJR6_PLEWA|nr:hypothetical protein NDU88_004730 [Pleurodeles waltl]